VIVQTAKVLGGRKAARVVTITTEDPKLYEAYDFETGMTRPVAAPERVGDIGVCAARVQSPELVGRGASTTLPPEGDVRLPLADGRIVIARVLRTTRVSTGVSVTIEWRIERI